MARLPSKYNNTLILGDCLDVMERLPAACIDLIYIDPPFATGKARKGQNLPIGPGGRMRRRDGGDAAGRADSPNAADASGRPRKQDATAAPGIEPHPQVFEYNDAWDGHLEGYLAWLEPRLQKMAALLKPTGALLVHLDGHASHYVKVLLDKIMGPQNFLNEIIWHYRTGGTSKRRMARKFDSIFWYAKGNTFTYNPEAAAHPGNQCPMCGQERAHRNHMKRTRDENGRPMLEIKSAGRTYTYYEDAPMPPCDVWVDIKSLHQRDPERTGYPSQKPLSLMERLVGLCSKPGDTVADFFAGTGTTLIAAARLKRIWLGCDAHEEALKVAGMRFDKLSLPYGDGADARDGANAADGANAREKESESP